MSERSTQINGSTFEVDELQPFGEVWTPKEGMLAIDDWIKRDIQAVVDEVRRAHLVVLENTVVNQHWRDVYAEPASEIPHTDQVGVQDLVVHMIYSDGDRHPTSYATNDALSFSARGHIEMLKELIDSAPQEIVRDNLLSFMLEDYRQRGTYVYAVADTIDPLQVMETKLRELPSRLSGLIWQPGQDNEKLLRDGKILERLYDGVRKFYLAVGKEAQKYTHNWKDHPHSTILSYQDTATKFRENGQADWVYHFRDTAEVPEDDTLIETPLLRNFIIRNVPGKDLELQYPMPRFGR